MAFNSFLFIGCLFLGFPAFAESLVHIEYGASNHSGQNPHFDPNTGFLGLELSINRLLGVYAPEGRIYLNDIDEVGLERTGRHLREWLSEKGIKAQVVVGSPSPEIPSGQLEIVLLPGDFLNLEVPHTHTAHLRNPAPEVMKALTYRSFVDARQTALARMIRASRSGLTIVVAEPKDLIYDPEDPPLTLVFETDYRRFFDVVMRPIDEIYHDFSIRRAFGMAFWARGETLPKSFFDVQISESVRTEEACERPLIGNPMNLD